jgi:hypothetical protein
MNELKGKKINKIYISKCKQAIKFECDDKVYKYKLDNDCCSDGWIEHFTFFDLYDKSNLEVIKIEEIEAKEVMPTLQEKDWLYCTKIFCDTGYIGIEYRNSSNGYYGSYISSIDEYKEDYDFVEIKESF